MITENVMSLFDVTYVLPRWTFSRVKCEISRVQEQLMFGWMSLLTPPFNLLLIR